MSCASGIYTVYSGSTAVPTGGYLPAGTTVRRYGKNLAQAGDGILLDGAGYYLINANVVVTGTGSTAGTGTTAGTVTLTLTEDGTPIQGGLSSVTIAPDSIDTITVHAIVRKKCCDTPTTIQIKNTGVNVTINQVSSTVIKV